MRMAVLVLQLLTTFVVTALVMPALLFTIPAARNDRVGLALMSGTAILVFVVLRLVWPRRRA